MMMIMFPVNGVCAFVIGGDWWPMWMSDVDVRCQAQHHDFVDLDSEL